ncbi:MAG: glycerophosphodiester phosphodiesterase [Alphaproteobacteria bacterium]
MPVFNFTFLPPVIAHRGVRSEAPENTMAAFAKVAASGASWIETDVKLTHDGVPILMHDDTVNRTTNGKGAVADLTWDDIQKLDAGSWFNPGFAGEPVPLLIDALRFVLDHNLRINLELKPCPGRTQATTMITLIEMMKIWPHNYPPPLLSSFDVEALTIASRLHPDWPRGLLLDEWHADWPELVSKTVASTINLNASLITQQRMRQLLQADLPILAYTVNDPLRAKELLHWGVTAVFSDNPREIIKAL